VGELLELACSVNAQPEIREAALRCARPLTRAVRERSYGEWHTPLLQADEATLDVEIRKQIRLHVARAFVVPNPRGTREIDKDLELYDGLERIGTEPVRTRRYAVGRCGLSRNFVGWIR